jgi:hypothetical protein
MAADSLVDSSIRSTADETDDLITVYHPNFALIPNIWTNTSISRIYRRNQYISMR